MVNAAKVDMKFIGSMPPKEEAAQSIIRGIYENFRLLGGSLLTARGRQTMDHCHHTQMIDALNELNIPTSRPIHLLKELKKLRNSINYDGYLPTQQEVEFVISIKKALWEPVLTEVKKQIE